MTGNDETSGPATDAGGDEGDVRGGDPPRSRDGRGAPSDRRARSEPRLVRLSPALARLGRDPGRADGRLLGHPADHRPGGQAEQGLQPLVPGRRVVLRQGLDIYPDPETGRLFPFMYPPSAAAMLGFLSLLGKHGTTLVLILAHSVAWIGAIVLSVWLATGGKIKGQHPILFVVPSLCIIALIHNTYLLGQPNLSLLTLLLAAFACLRLGRQAWAGVLVATAAAIKAFPILALGYFVYRRMWRASFATVAALLSGCWSSRSPSAPPPRPSTTWPGLVARAWSSPTTPTGSPSARIARSATRTSRSWRWRTGSSATCRPTARRCSRSSPPSATRGGRRWSGGCSPTARSTWPRCSPPRPPRPRGGTTATTAWTRR